MADGGKNNSKEINTNLKAAKEAIKQKEYKDALKHCKNVIKLDKGNYHAFVFIGLCAKEMEQFEKSRAAYIKAIEQNPEEILAWQGLSNLYEAASNEEWNQDHIEVYSKLISANKNDLTKWKELLAKVIPLQLSMGLASEALQNLKDLEGTTPEPSEDLLNYWRKCLSLFESKVRENELSIELQNQMENAFHSVLEYSRILGIETEKPQQDHLLFLRNSLKKANEKSKADFFEQQILEKGRVILEQHPDNIYTLELMIRVLMEQSYAQLAEETMKYIERLTDNDSSKSLIAIGSAFMKTQRKLWMEATTSLKEIENQMGKDYIPLFLLLMSKSYFHLHDPKLSFAYAERGLKDLQKCLTETGRSVYCSAFMIRKSACFVESKNYENAKELLVKLLDEDPANLEALNLLGNVYAFLENNENALEICKKLEEIEPNYHGCLAVKALISTNEGKFYDAELRLQEAIERKGDLPQYHFLLGKVYWNLRTDDMANAKKAHSSFLKAAKLDPYNSAVFFALGEFYRDIPADLKKAQKCFQKAVSLDEFNEEAALALGDISIDLGDEDNAVDVYEKATKHFGPGRVKIAWLRLGMLLTKRGSPEKAVTCFQGAIRCDPTDRLLYECLGDAYIARGSYIAAVKTFERALEIEPSSIFCRYKVGVIKQSICVYPEAIDEFNKVIAVQEDYIPAIKGVADCHLKLEYASIAEDFDGRAVDHAKEVLIAASKAIQLRPDLRCFWKIIGDACFALDVIVEEKLSFEIPSSISKMVGLKIIENQAMKSVLLDLSRRCYAAVVKLEENSANAWHDFALSSFHFGMSLGDEAGKAIIQQSIQLIKRAINLEPQNYKMWNTLGVISASSDIANPDLSQHAFIKALQLEPQNAEVWTNLGTLYLKYNKVETAHEAFKKAQDADPSYTPAWVGQASIAEIIGNHDAMDLFRHSSELGSNAEGFLAYAKWVCFELKDFYKKRKPSLWKIDSFHLPPTVRKAIANSSVCAQKYSERIPGNPCALNLLGVLLEHQSLFKQAQSAFERSHELLKSTDEIDKKNMVLSNLARVLRQSGQYKNAIEAYLDIKPLVRPDDVSGLALSYHFDGQIQLSFQTYEQALNLSEDERDKSDIYATMGMVAYTNGNADLAKSLLFKSSQTASPSEQGLMALSAFGLLSNDNTLTNAALAEIEKHPDFRTESVEGSYAYLNSAMNLLQGNIIQAKRSILRVIRRYPASSKLWNKLATFICQKAPILPLDVAGRCAEIASIHQASDLSLLITAAASIGSKSFAMTSLHKKHYITCLRAAQRAVHSNPEKPENWALLAAAALVKSVCIGNESNGSTAISTARLSLLKAEENLSQLEEALKTTVSHHLFAKRKIAVKLRVHAIRTLIWAYLQTGGYDIALLLSDNAITQYEGDQTASNELLFLKIVSEILLKWKQGGNVDELLASALSVCDAEDGSILRYQVLSNLSFKLGLPLISEFAIRKCVQYAAQNGFQTLNYNCLIQLALISIKCFCKDKNEKWFDLATEAVTEASKLNPGHYLIDFVRMALLHNKGDAKKIQKILGRLERKDEEIYARVIRCWHSLYGEEEQNEIVDKDLYECQNWT